MVSSGMPLAAAMSLRGRPFHRSWTGLVEAAEEAGRLPEALERISARISRRAAVARSLRASLAYPVFLLHGALFLWPLGTLLQEGGGAYLARVAVSLFLVWGTAVAVAVPVARSLRRAGEAGVSPRWPILGPILRELRAAEVCWSLGALYESGASLRRAVEFVFPAPPAAEAPLARALERFRGGDAFAEFARECRLFSEDTVHVLRIGEASGNLGEALLSEGKRLEARAEARLEGAARWAGRAIYGIAVAAAAWVILSFWLDYLGAITAIASITTRREAGASALSFASESRSRCRRTRERRS
jgi:type II secretory pathway component PulF